MNENLTTQEKNIKQALEAHDSLMDVKSLSWAKVQARKKAKIALLKKKYETIREREEQNYSSISQSAENNGTLLSDHFLDYIDAYYDFMGNLSFLEAKKILKLNDLELKTFLTAEERIIVGEYNKRLKPFVLT